MKLTRKDIKQFGIIVRDAMSAWTQRKNWNRIGWIIAIETALLMILATFFLPGGDDIYRYYLPFSGGCLDCGFIPYFARWLLWPLAHLPLRLVWPVWTVFSLAGWLVLCRRTGINPALFLLAFPSLGQFWLGQIDILICVGLAVALFAKNPYLRGIGLALALIKPQVTAIPIFFLLTHERQFLKVLVAPMVIFALSLMAFGIGWPLDWFMNAIKGVPVHVWRLASMEIWPLGLVLIWTPFLFKDRQARFQVATLVSVLATPFVGVYSYVVFLLFSPQLWWSLPLSYVWFLAYPLWQEGAMRLAWILPAALLLSRIYTQFKTHAKSASL